MVVVLVALITLDILLGVFFRYVIGDALSWNEELARYMMIWMGFIAAGLVLREGNHIGMTVLRKAMPRPVAAAAVLVSDLLILLYLAVLCWTSWQVLEIIRYDITSGLNIQMFFPFLVMPVGSALLIFHQLSILPEHLRMFRPRSPASEETPQS